MGTDDQVAREAIQDALSVQTESWDEVLELSPDILVRLRDLAEGLNLNVTGIPLEAGGDGALPKFGRFRTIRQLGRGGFGEVYLAHDPELNRSVAIKRLLAKFNNLTSFAQLRKEARAVARLTHPSIVSIFDIVRDNEVGCYIVMEYVDGPTLSTLLKQGQLDLMQASEWARQIAVALDYAHRHKVIHRDIKPSNVLIDADQNAFITDFGLALTDAEATPRERHRVGTPAYMSPEQVNAEPLRIGRHSDIWGLGVTMYQMFTGKRPFAGDDVDAIFRAILGGRPTRLRRLNRDVPKQLERICLRCLARSQQHRYAAASDLANDLQQWQADVKPATFDLPRSKVASDQSGSGGSTFMEPAYSVVPKGLQSFDQHDADFFLELLPGPHDRLGVPESVRFWKQCLQQREGAASICLLYGPSGCGKSSLVKAGVMPLLEDTKCYYLEATNEGTEARMLGQLRDAYELNDEWPFADSMLALREMLGEQRQKAVVIIDQFEQWLHGRTIDANEPLVQALRQFDGGHLQCLLMIRDDFWMPVSAMMDALEVPMVAGQNVGAVQRFSLSHAAHVLASFGGAYGAIELSGQIPSQQRAFMRQAVEELAEDGSVPCVHLAIFAEMMKSRPWRPSTLRAIGGAQGVGVAFLEQTFQSEGALPSTRDIEDQATKILAALLPPSGVVIKGHQRSRQQLAEAAGVELDRVDELLKVLESELRVIARAPDVEGKERSQYQLTHDFLVAPVREWIRRKEGSTWQGRARLQLEDAATYWKENDSIHGLLPSPLEYVTYVRGVPKSERSSKATEMMGQAGRFYGRRGLFVAGALAALGVVGVQYNRIHQRDFVQQATLEIIDARPYAVGEKLSLLRKHSNWSIPVLEEQLVANPSRQFRISTLLFILGGEVNATNCRGYVAQLGDVEPAEFENALSAVRSWPEDTRRELAREVMQRNFTAAVRFAVLLQNLGESSAVDQLLRFRKDPKYRTAVIHQHADWFYDKAILARHFEAASDEAVLSGLCKLIGRMSPHQLDASTKARLVARLNGLYENSEFGSVHSAARWALTAWGEGLPELSHAAGKRNWCTDGDGLTLVRIEPRFGEKYEPFLISSSPIQFHLFETFAKSPGEGHPHKLALHQWHNKSYMLPEAPAAYLTYFEAVRFCNWLSRRHNLKPYYVDFHDQEQLDKEQPLRSLIREGHNTNEEANGFRLPNEFQIKMAAYGGVQTAYHFGDDLELLAEYEWGSSSTYDPKVGNHVMQPSAQKLPNDFGLFDVLGNVRIWVRPDDAEFNDGRGLARYWGAYCGQVHALFDDVCEKRKPTYEQDDQGFRVCRPAETP